MFNPARLSVARKRRQMTKKLLAEKANISQLTLTRIENGDTLEPEEETISSLAKALSYPEQFFYGDECDELTVDQVSFRSLKAMTAKQKDSALAAGVVARLFDDWINDRFNLPKPDLPDLRDEDPEFAAIALRKYWGIGSRPIPHLIKLLESKGIRVFSLAENNKNVDAFSCWRDGIPYIFLNTFKSAERSRFDAAHEIGHLVLHKHSGTNGRDVEREADKFASSLLIPRDDFISQLPKIRSLDQLVVKKSRWGVSVAALARTAFDTGILSDWHYRDLCKKISYLGYRTEEPQPMEREESIVWRKIFEELWQDRITKYRIASDLSIPVDELSALLDGVMGKRPLPTVKQSGFPKLKAV